MTADLGHSCSVYGQRVPARLAGRRIGLLGGSFNPAHAGHRHISLEALKRLELDEIWWLVSPRNPLKAEAGLASFSKRLAEALRIAAHPRIRVLDLERRLGTFYSVDTIGALRRRHPRAHFVWLMGADNFATFHLWRAWKDIFHLLPVAILDRPHYSIRGPVAKAAQHFRRYRVAERNAAALAELAPPAWVFIHIPLHPLSATELRARDAGWLEDR